MTPQSHRSVTLTRLVVVLWCVLEATANSAVSHAHPTFSASAPHQFYSCPEGATVKLLCSLKGVAMDPKDKLTPVWRFTQHSDQHCHNNRVRQPAGDSHLPGNHSYPPGVDYGTEKETFWVELKNLVPSDQGRYCCLVVDVPVDHKHGNLQQARSHVILHITPKRNDTDCTIWDPNPPPGASVSAVLATVACIMALLSLPLILILMYRQRQSANASRRAHELVRMDSEAQGHENPVFQAGPPGKTRTVSQIMTRQSSETGRHLLSEPGTPLSPPSRGDVFFPANDTIPESPDFMSV